MYSPDFIVDSKILSLSLHYYGDNSYLFVNGTVKKLLKILS